MIYRYETCYDIVILIIAIVYYLFIIPIHAFSSFLTSNSTCNLDTFEYALQFITGLKVGGMHVFIIIFLTFPTIKVPKNFLEIIKVLRV